MATLEQLAQALQEVRQQLGEERQARLAAEQRAAGAGRAEPAQAGGRLDGGNEQHIDPQVLNKCPIFSGKEDSWA